MRGSRDDWMWQTARKLARSGTCASWRDIDRKLAALGYLRASEQWSESFRTVLDRLCATSSRGGRAAA